MNKSHLKSSQEEQVARKLIELSSITFNLKSISYAMANIPIETVKHKSTTRNSSVLSTIDSIYFDLKKILTILQQQLKSSKTESFKKLPFNSHSSSSNIHFQNHLKTSQFRALYIPNTHYHKPNVYQSNHTVFKKQQSNPHLHLVDQHFSPNQLSQDTQENDEKYFISQTLPVDQQKKRKRSHKVGISQVSSYQYVGFSQNPTIKGQFHKLSNAQLNPSQLNYQNSSIKLNKFCLEESHKQAENQIFLRQISKSRQKILKSIQRKKAKCMDAIKNINSNFIQTSPYQESKLSKKCKLKSKTQKFFNQETKILQNHQKYAEFSQQFVGI